MSQSKPNKIWVDEGSEFNYRSMKSWLQGNDLEMFSTHKDGKSVVGERYIMALKNKIYKDITTLSINMYVEKLDYWVINRILHIMAQLRWNLLLWS